MPKFQTYYWSLGTTSFRTKNFNEKIELQLRLLDEFWELPENQNQNWLRNTELQSRYYDFILEQNFVEGDARNKAKDAREKTSGLVDIGFISDNRKLTDAGESLLEISDIGDFSADNDFQIPKDSYIYLRQLLKTTILFPGDIYANPFIVFIYLLSEVEYLSFEEFTYLLPLCINRDITNDIVSKIRNIRDQTMTVDDVISEVFMEKTNYQYAYSLFRDNNVDEELICRIGVNRKSRTYDIPYYSLYNELKGLFLEGEITRAINVLEATKAFTIGKYWRNFLFTTSNTNRVRNSPEQCLRDTEFSNIQTEEEFKCVFFTKLHLFKAKATLADYFDLNQRYMKMTDVVLFLEDRVMLDTIPKQFFFSVIEELYEFAFSPNELLKFNCSLEEIAPCLSFNEEEVIRGINNEFGMNIATMREAQEFIEDERYQRLSNLIETRFTDENLLRLLELFESRNDDEINAMVTDNATIPTIFEYILGIIWYKISEQQGKILDYMKLSLEADLLPRTHASGGDADIVYEYEAGRYYPEHSLLLEATLSEAGNQRRMEMEPVSRHLGQHLLNTGNNNSYCIFVTNYLNINVISDFQARRSYCYYDPNNYDRCINGMKIIPIEVEDLKNLIRNQARYAEIYPRLEEVFNLECSPPEWKNHIKMALNGINGLI